MNLTFKINKPINTVFEYLSDMQKFASVHPVISKIDSVSENNYLVHETLKFGFIPFSFIYPITIEKNCNDKKIIIRAVVMKITKIEMSCMLGEDANSTIVNETLVFKSLLPIKLIMKMIFKKQHALLFANIEALK